MARGRQQGDEAQRQRQAHGADAAQRAAPAEEFSEKPCHHAPGHAAKGGAGNVEPHGEAQASRLDLLGKIGDGDGRHPAERQALQGADDEDGMPARRDGSGEIEQAGEADRGEHQFAPAKAFGHRGGGENSDGEQPGGQRKRQRALRRADAEMRGEKRQQRLHAIDQREGGEAGQEQGKADLAIGRRASDDIGHDIGGRIGGHAEGRRLPALARCQAECHSQRRQRGEEGAVPFSTKMEKGTAGVAFCSQPFHLVQATTHA